ncbi:MAG: tetratricopeptide repeat protein [Thermodesulfovibrionales bacterium]|nr:tetratricopeptide repeat protein [Thermodesulfovibrionales bacterium]
MLGGLLKSALLFFLFTSNALSEAGGPTGYFVIGDWKRVIEEFHAKDRQNMSAEEVRQLALSFYFLGRLDEAEVYVKPLIKEDKQAETIYYLIIAGKGKIKEALKALSEIDTPEALTAKAVIIKNTQPEEALRLLNEVIARNEEYFWAWFYRGLVLEEKQDFLNAAKAYKKALSINPLFAQAHNNLGYCYKEMHYYSWAVEEYLKAIELIPDNAGYYYNLGNAYTHLEKIEEAFNAYKKAVELDPYFAKAHYNLARTYLRKDMVREAIEEFRLYLKYGTREVFRTVASKKAVQEEIEQLEEYLRLYGPVK